MKCFNNATRLDAFKETSANNGFHRSHNLTDGHTCVTKQFNNVTTKLKVGAKKLVV